MNSIKLEGFSNIACCEGIFLNVCKCRTAASALRRNNHCVHYMDSDDENSQQAPNITMLMYKNGKKAPPVVQEVPGCPAYGATNILG